MFGYVVADKSGLTEEQLSCYSSYYCGLCRSLEDRFGKGARFTLNYDMTFLILILTSLYEPEAQEEGTERCIAHPKKKRRYIENRYTDYAADMNIALSYYNARDDWKDDRNASGLAYSGYLKKRYMSVRETYPRQCTELESGLSSLSKLEKADSRNPDAASEIFGRIMGEIFVYQEDYWADRLRNAGMLLGQFVYMMDACLDLKSDIRHKRWNPLKGEFEKDSPAEYKDMLTMLIGECTLEFEKLPLVENIDIIRNILYSGVWQRYNSEIAKYGDVKNG